MSKNVAIAYSVKRRAGKKKMAEGGTVKEGEAGPPSAKVEPRPMPKRMDDSGKAPKNDSWTDRPDKRQSGMGKSFPLKHPTMVPSDAFSVRLRDVEDKLQKLAGVNDGPQEQPPKDYDEKGADRQGPESRDLKLKMMANGGVADADHDDNIHNKAVDGEYGDGAEEDRLEHPKGLTEDNDEKAPPSKEYMAGYMAGMYASGGTVESGSLDMNYADGGEVSDMAKELDSEDPIRMNLVDDDSERENDEDSSMAAAIMAKRRKMAEGGRVDLSINADEEPNNEDQMSFEALKKENYSESEGLKQLDQPEDSNEDGRETDSDKHDRVSSIRSKMKKRSPMSR